MAEKAKATEAAPEQEAPVAAPAEGKKTALLSVVTPFEVLGVRYGTGDTVPAEQWQQWPDGSLARRLENKFVEWAAVAAN